MALKKLILKAMFCNEAIKFRVFNFNLIEVLMLFTFYFGYSIKASKTKVEFKKRSKNILLLNKSIIRNIMLREFKNNLYFAIKQVIKIEFISL